METTKSIIKSKMELLSQKELICTSKVMGYFFGLNLMDFVPGLNREAYIEYVSTRIMDLSGEAVDSVSILSVFNKAIKLVKEQAN